MYNCNPEAKMGIAITEAIGIPDMILKHMLTHTSRNVLLAAMVMLSTGLGAFGAKPATMPATQKSPAVSSDPLKNLRNALPDGWSLQGTLRIARTDMHPGMQWSRVPTAYMKLRSSLIQTKEGLQREAPPIIVWLAQRQAVKVKWRATEIQQDIEQKSTDHLGAGPGYHVYVHLPPAAAKIWKTARLDIAKALGVKVPTSQPAEKRLPRSIILVTQKGDAVSYTVDGVQCADRKALAKAMTLIPKDFSLVIQIATNVPAGRVAEILAAARKLRLMKVSINVIQTSRPPVKPEKRLDL
jgi:hypothetical protein